MANENSPDITHSLNRAGVRRRLSAVLSADVKDYSRLMEDDEFATLETLTSYRTVMADRIQANHGRVVDSPGDNLLAEFPSVMDAVQAAIQIQKHLAALNKDLPSKRRMDFRIGVNCGDILADGESIYGDGVNIAARLEGESEPGGVCLSGQAYAQVRNKIEYGFCPLGELKVKNIAQPVEAWKLELDPEEKGCKTGLRAVFRTGQRRGRLMLAVLGLVVVLLAAAAALGLNGSLPGPLQTWFNQALSRDGEKGILEAVKSPPVPPDLPSVAVMPFANQSQDPAQEYFADGVTEDIITDLSRISGLFVISRAASFYYKNRTYLPAQVGRELGVRYLVEGSVRRVGSRIRISARLINAKSGFQVWADRWDRAVEDIFTLQDELIRKIVSALEVGLSKAEAARLARRGTNSVAAYEFYKRGRELANRFTKADNAKAKQMFQRAIELDRDYAHAYVGLGWVYFQEWPLGWADQADSLEPALEAGRRALAIDDSLPEAHVLVGWALLWEGRFEPALNQGRRALELAPNNPEALSFMGNALGFTGKPEEALRLIKKALRLNPRLAAQDLYSLAHALWQLGASDKAVKVLGQILERNPKIIPARVLLTVILIEAGRLPQAEEQVAAILEADPDYTAAQAARRLPYQDKEKVKSAVAALIKAGLPQGKPKAKKKNDGPI